MFGRCVEESNGDLNFYKIIIIMCLLFIQELKALHLHLNRITDGGAEFLAIALNQNRVKKSCCHCFQNSN
jgi:cell division protein ZapA (FtsZ GTPase activity inhibitor)